MIGGLLAWLALDRHEALWLLVGFGALRVLRDRARIQRAFKREVLRRLFEFALPEIEYDPDGRLPAEQVRRSGLFPEPWNRDSGEDRVSGRVGATEFHCSEPLLTRRRKKRSDVVFSGLFFVADFHKSFRGRTFLLPDRAERLFGSIGRAAQSLPRFDGTRLVELEDTDFEKRFVCYATDPIQAR